MEEFDRTRIHPDPLPDQAGGPAKHAPDSDREASLRDLSPPRGASGPLDSPIFDRFGGEVALERAISIAALEEALMTSAQKGALHRMRSVAALHVFSLLAASRLPRRGRLLLRRIPRRYIDRAEALAERMLVAWSARRRAAVPGETPQSVTKTGKPAHGPPEGAGDPLERGIAKRV
jgi:hypothetical protein